MIKIHCPAKCWAKVEMAIDEIPAEVRCPECGASLKIGVALLPAKPKPSQIKRVSNLAAA